MVSSYHLNDPLPFPRGSPELSCRDSGVKRRVSRGVRERHFDDSECSEIHFDSECSEIHFDSECSEIHFDSEGSEIHFDSEGSEIHFD
ncbi:hypothetical protein NPIL_29421, partial [Nephila pilipes]